jgi:hypothetical protein
MERRYVCQVFVKRRLIAERKSRSQTPLERQDGDFAELAFEHPLFPLIRFGPAVPGGAGITIQHCSKSVRSISCLEFF